MNDGHKQFTYKVLAYHENSPISTGELRELGLDGWELVAIDGDNIYFKREIIDTL